MPGVVCGRLILVYVSVGALVRQVGLANQIARAIASLVPDATDDFLIAESRDLLHALARRDADREIRNEMGRRAKGKS